MVDRFPPYPSLNPTVKKHTVEAVKVKRRVESEIGFFTTNNDEASRRDGGEENNK